MLRSIILSASLSASLVLAIPPGAPTRAQQGVGGQQKGSLNVQQATAQEQFYSTQAGLFSALAQAQALERISTMQGETNFSLARTLIRTANREMQGAVTSSVNIGKALHEAEDTEAMTELRTEINAAIMAADEASMAADGHGTISPNAKNMVAHLLRAMEALVMLSAELDVDAMPAPGHQAIMDAKARLDQPPRRRTSND